MRHHVIAINDVPTLVIEGIRLPGERFVPKGYETIRGVSSVTPRPRWSIILYPYEKAGHMIGKTCNRCATPVITEKPIVWMVVDGNLQDEFRKNHSPAT